MFVEKLKSYKISRNILCPCGSGIKAKKCCLKKIQEKEIESRVQQQLLIKKFEKEGRLKVGQKVWALDKESGLGSNSGKISNIIDETTVLICDEDLNTYMYDVNELTGIDPVSKGF